VDHARMVGELGCSVDHPEQLDYALDAIEAAQLRAHDREQVDADRARVLVCLVGRVIPADLARRALAARVRARALSGEKQQVAGAHGIDVVGDRGRYLAELEPERLEPLLRAHGSATILPGLSRFSGSNVRFKSRIR